MFATAVKTHMVEIVFAVFDLQTISLLGEDFDGLLTLLWHLKTCGGSFDWILIFGMALVFPYLNVYLTHSQYFDLLIQVSWQKNEFWVPGMM